MDERTLHCGKEIHMNEPRIHAILRADLKGLPDTYIMEKMDISQHILNRIRNSELYQERFTALQDRADEQALDKVRDIDDPVSAVLQKAAVNAANTNVGLLESENEKVAQASAWDILDRTGHPKATRTESTQRQVVTVDVETLKALGDALALTPQIEPEPERNDDTLKPDGIQPDGIQPEKADEPNSV